MTFGLSPPPNVKNVFGNWLVGTPKKYLVIIRVGVYDVLWAMWNVRNDFIFNKLKNQLFASYSYGYALDPYVILSPTSGGVRYHRF
jgi:hypothetical protein